MNQERDIQIIELKIAYNLKLISELEENGGRKELVEKYKKNIRYYEKLKDSISL